MTPTPSKSRLSIAAAVAGSLAAALLLTTTLSGQIAVTNQGFVPFSDEPINYRSQPNDPVAQLQQQLERGEVALEHDPKGGYLRSVLRLLKIPISSQMLVFSKTSFQYRKISPQTPRALYFNDDVYVGQVHEGKALELISFDARQGAIFYLLDEAQAGRPRFQRAELDCTVCHVAAGTRNVPGVLVRSVYATSTGTQAGQTPAFVTGHQSPLSERFGGWYVTGTHGAQTHLGNVTVQSRERPVQIASTGANVVDLSAHIDTSPYLSPHSDIVAQLVQAHQTQMHNLITLTNYQTRIALYEEARKNGDGVLSDAARARFERPAEELVRYLLFADEAPLAGQVRGTSGFAEEFSARGPRDSRGRSLRDFDLERRLFKYPLSYLIYTDAFDALPERARTYVYDRLLQILTAAADSDEFWNLTAADRRAVLEILIDTKPGLPDGWARLKNEGRPVDTSALQRHRER